MKTIMDAVNDLQGDLNNSYEYAGNETGLLYISDKYLAFIDFYGDDPRVICTTKDFKELVKECENNFGQEQLNKFNEITRPSHYDILDQNTIILIARTCSMEMWKGACQFNIMKYRLRMGKKDDVMKELEKADNYNDNLYHDFLPYCYDYKAIK